MSFIPNSLEKLDPASSRRKGLASRWCWKASTAVLVLVALSSVLPVAPADAVVGQADGAFQGTGNPACPDPEAVSKETANRFRDIDADHAHAATIGCIVYYGITSGTGDGSRFSPTRSVTRWQMALFMARAVEAAGVDLPTAQPSFEDLDELGDSTVEAIGTVSTLGIMEGRNRQKFSLNAAVRRDEMAVHLVRMLDLLTGSGSDIDVTVDRQTGEVTLSRPDGSVVPQNDSFPDLSDVSAEEGHAIGAVFELGVTAGRSDGSYDPEGKVQRQHMATFIIRALDHSDLRPRGAIELEPWTETDDEITHEDPLGLIAHASFARDYTLPGPDGDVFEVWLCNTPLSGNRYSDHPDNKHNPSNYATKFASQVVEYFDWLSDGNYRPVFRPGGAVTVGSSKDYYRTCKDKVLAKDLKRWSKIDGVVIVVGVPVPSEGIIRRATCGLYSQRSFPDNRRYVMVNGDAYVNPTLLAHEMGHALCWPHSYSGETIVDGEVYEYDNPMDVMGSPSSSESAPVPYVGTLAINRYAAGWIPTSQVEIHQLGTTKRYRLEPISGDGVQLVIIPNKVGD